MIIANIFQIHLNNHIIASLTLSPINCNNISHYLKTRAQKEQIFQKFDSKNKNNLQNSVDIPLNIHYNSEVKYRGVEQLGSSSGS